MNQNPTGTMNQASTESEGGLNLGLGSIDPKEIAGMVSTFACENPHAALAGACAIGFLLGGGLTPRIITGIALMAGRAYTNKMMRSALEGVAREQFGH